MKRLFRFAASRKILIPVSCAAAALFCRYAAPGLSAGSRLYIGSAYYFTIALVLLWGIWLIKIIVSNRTVIKERADNLLPGIALSALLCVIIAASVEPKVRVLNDQPRLLSQSQAMTFNGKAGIINRARIESGRPVAEEFLLPMRPPLYPFLVSALHTLAGYRPSNAYALNYLILFILLTAVYAVLRKRCSAACGITAVLLVASQPILSLCAASPGYELLFLACLAVCFLNLHAFLKSRSAPAFEMLWLNLLILAYIRVESLLYGLIILAVLALRRCLQKRHFRSALLFVITPWLLIIPVWNKYLTFGNAASNYGHYLRNQWSLDYLLRNAGDFFRSVVDFRLYLPFASPVNLAGLLACAAAVVIAASLWRRADANTKTLFLAATAVTTFNAAIVLPMRCGSPYCVPASRFYLLPCFLLSLAAAAALRRIIPAKKRALMPVLAAFVFCLFHPVAVGDHYFKDHDGWNRHYDTVMEFLKDRQDPGAFVINQAPLYHIVEGYGGCDFSYANKNVDEILRGIEREPHKNTYVVQHIAANSGEPASGFRLQERYRLKTLRERRKDADTLMRISLVLPEQDFGK